MIYFRGMVQPLGLSDQLRSEHRGERHLAHADSTITKEMAAGPLLVRVFLQMSWPGHKLVEVNQNTRDCGPLAPLPGVALDVDEAQKALLIGNADRD